MSLSIRAGLAIGMLVLAISPAAAQYPGPATPGFGQGGGASFSQTLGGGPVADIWLRYNYADQTVGYKGEYFTVGGIMPIQAANSPNAVWFTQLQGNYSENSKFFGNIGFGRRAYMSDAQRMFGVSGWYDYDDDSPNDVFTHKLQQIGVNFETAGPYMDFRCNGYFPVGPQSFTYGLTCDNLVYGFVGNSLVRPGVDSALTGVDWAVSMQPEWEFFQRWGIRGNIGMYNYRSDVVPNFTGVMGGFQVQPGSDRVLFRYQATYDERYGDTHTVMASVNLFSPRSSGRDLLAMPAQRNDHILRFYQQTFEYTNPTTGTPYVVRHVDNSAPAGGDGTAENPYNNVEDINGAGSTVGDLVFVEDTGIDYVLGTDVLLKDNQRLLGEGMSHGVATVEAGTISVNCGNTSGMPVLTGGFGIVLANNNEVSNFNIVTPGPFGIGGGAVTDFNINTVIVNGATADGIFIADAQGTGLIEGVQLLNGTNEGVNVATTGPLDLTVRNNTFDSNAGTGLFLTTNAGANTVTMNVTANTFSNNGQAIDSLNNGTAGGRFNLSITGNNLASNDYGGGLQTGTINVVQNGVADYLSTINIDSNTITPDQAALVDDTVEIRFDITGGYSIASISNNIIFNKLGANDPGVIVNASGASRLQLGMNNNLFTTTGTGAQFIDGTMVMNVTNAAEVFATISNNSNPSLSNSVQGIYAGYLDVLSANTSRVVLVVQNNITDGTGGPDYAFTTLNTSAMALALSGNAGPDDFDLNAGGSTFQLDLGVNTGTVNQVGVITTPPTGGPPVTRYVNPTSDPAGILTANPNWIVIP